MSKKVLTVIFSCLSFVLQAQIITTVTGTFGGTIYDPQQMAFDLYGNLYIGEALGNKVIKISNSGVITTFAGTGIPAFSGDGGPATNAELYAPGRVATDTLGNVYIADGNNNRIRNVDVSTGVIHTIAGDGVAGFYGDSGSATLARFNGVGGICFDKKGNLYIEDVSNYRIRKIDTSGIITTIAGNGISGCTGDGGAAIFATCGPGGNICFDDTGNFYFVDFVGFNVRKIDTFGVISTVAGSGITTYNGEGISATLANLGSVSIAFDPTGHLVISDYANKRVRRIDGSGFINTIAGNGINGYTGDNGPADAAEIKGPNGIAFDTCGNLFIAQINSPCIRKVSFNPSCIPQRVFETSITQLTIYPNPSSYELHIDNLRTSAEYALFNIVGIIEQSGTLKKGNNSISIQALLGGVYILQLIDDEGRRTVKKIIKE